LIPDRRDSQQEVALHAVHDEESLLRTPTEEKVQEKGWLAGWLETRWPILIAFVLFFTFPSLYWFNLTYNLVMASHKGAAKLVIVMGTECSKAQRNASILVLAWVCFSGVMVKALFDPKVGNAVVDSTVDITQEFWLYSVLIAISALAILIMTTLMLMDYFGDSNLKLNAEVRSPASSTVPAKSGEEPMQCHQPMVDLVETLTPFALVQVLPIIINARKFIYLPLKHLCGK
jgi:hypothetical protein